jgi:hypothetical protein
MHTSLATFESTRNHGNPMRICQAAVGQGQNHQEGYSRIQRHFLQRPDHAEEILLMVSYGHRWWKNTPKKIDGGILERFETWQIREWPIVGSCGFC